MNGVMKGDLIEEVETQRGRRSEILEELQIPRSTYYQWRKAYGEEGIAGFQKVRSVFVKWGQAIVIKYFFLLFSLRFISMISTLLKKSLSCWRSFSTFFTPRFMVIGSRLKC